MNTLDQASADSTDAFDAADAAGASQGAALPTVADMVALAESLDAIDYTLAELDQPQVAGQALAGREGL